MPVDLIIGGASKAGTTALYEILKQSPAFFLPTKKELHYFSYQFLKSTSAGPGDAHVIAEIPAEYAQYRKHFEGKRDNQIAIDVSPSYLFHYGSAEQIYKILPSVKVVFIIRNPVEKIFSQYIHLLGEGREHLTFKDALAIEEERRIAGYSDMWLYRRSGFYANSVSHFLDIFGRDQVMIVLYDDFRKDPVSVLRDLCIFAGLDGTQKFSFDINYNTSGVPKSKIVAKLIAPNYFTRLLRKILPTPFGVQIRRLIRTINTGAKPKIDPSIYKELLNTYHEDILRFESLIGRQTGWLK